MASPQPGILLSWKISQSDWFFSFFQKNYFFDSDSFQVSLDILHHSTR